MRIARIMAILLALVTLAITAYYLRLMPYIYLILIPPNIGATGSLLFWIKAPTRKKARWRAALASLMVVPCMIGTSRAQPVHVAHVDLAGLRRACCCWR